jgi:hypothetical protein
MDADHANGLVWETYTSTGLYAFGPTDSVGTYFDISAHIPPTCETGMSGLAVYPCGGATGLAVACYASTQVLFFEYADGSVTYTGCGELPRTIPILESYGLAFADSRGTLYWSAKEASGSHYLTELSASGPGFCYVFADGFETGDTTAWTETVQ